MSQEFAFEISALKFSGPQTSFELSLKVQSDEILSLVADMDFSQTDILQRLLASQPKGKASFRQLQCLPADLRAGFHPLFSVEEQLCATSRLLPTQPPAHEVQKFVRSAIEAVGMEADSIQGKLPHEIPMQSLLRLHFARLFLIRPQILVLADPFPLIPLGAQAELIAFIKDFRHRSKMSILLLTSDIALAGKLGNHIYILGESTVIEHGTPDEVLHRPQHTFTQRLVAQNIHLLRSERAYP
jgi:ABC-type microcin C transport system duplicated ATPase subunit YejF